MREKFEAWVMKHVENTPHLRRYKDLMLLKYPDGSYHQTWVDSAWLGFQAGLGTADAELAKLREQEPVAWMLECQQWTGDTAWLLSWSKSGAGQCDRLDGESHQRALYERPIPRERSDSIPAPATAATAVPEEWRKVMVELADDLAIEIDQNYPPERRVYPSEQRRYEGEMEIVNRAHALLQSTPQAPTVPDDRVSQDESTLTMAASALVLFRAGESAEYMAKAIEALLQSAPQSEVTK